MYGRWPSLEAARGLAVVWLRMAMALQIVMLAGGPSLAAIYLPVALFLATPLVLVHRWICRRHPPFLRPGYWLAAVYGPVLLLGLAAAGVCSVGDAVFGSMFYEIGALLVTAVYIVLWRAGDRWLGPQDQPRIVRRWIATFLLVGLLCLYVPFVRRATAIDTCLDRGGRVDRSGGCDL